MLFRDKKIFYYFTFSAKKQLKQNNTKLSIQKGKPKKLKIYLKDS